MHPVTDYASVPGALGASIRAENRWTPRRASVATIVDPLTGEPTGAVVVLPSGATVILDEDADGLARTRSFKA